MVKKKLIVWGATGQAHVLDEILRSKFEVIAFFDKNQIASPVHGVPLYVGFEGFEQWAQQNIKIINEVSFIVAIGGDKGKDRIATHDFLISRALKPISAIHPTAFLAYNAKTSEGLQVLANSTVCVKVRLGKSVIINTGASVDHESIIGDGVHIGPGAKLAGCVNIGDFSFIGTGVVILPRVIIGNNTIIGAGSVVTKDIPDNVVAYGNPCKVIRYNK